MQHVFLYRQEYQHLFHTSAFILLLSSENKMKYIAKMRKKIDVNRFTPLWAVIFFDPLMICTCHKKGGASTVN